MTIDAGHNGKRWVRLAADYSLDPSVIEAGWDAELIYLRGLTYSRLIGSDGRLPMSGMRHIAAGYEGDPAAAVYRLIDQGLWVPWPDGRGWSIRNYSEWQQTEMEYRIKAQQNAERQRRYRERRAQDRKHNGDAPDLGK